jgi:hypothetical protein
MWERSGALGRGCRVGDVCPKAEAQTDPRDAYWKLFDAGEITATGHTPDRDMVAAGQRRIDLLVEQHGRVSPASVKCLLSDGSS